MKIINPMQRLQAAEDKHYYLVSLFLYWHKEQDFDMIRIYSKKALKAKQEIKKIKKILDTPQSEQATFILQ